MEGFCRALEGDPGSFPTLMASVSHLDTIQAMTLLCLRYLQLLWAGSICPHVFMWYTGHGDKNFHWGCLGDNTPQKQRVPKQAQQDSPVWGG